MRTLWLVGLLAVVATGCAESRTLTPGPTPTGTIDVVGTWHDCATTVTFTAEGTATLTDHRQDCTTSGTYGLDANVLEMTWDDATCARSPHVVRELLQPDGALVLVDPETASVTRWFDDATPRTAWRFESTTPARASIVRIVGAPGMGQGSGCYWSADHACGGLFSCGGAVLGWRSDASMLHGTTVCDGECPCGAVFDGTALADGTFDGTYRGATCEAPLNGTFTVTSIDL